jgi:hypothetical protein
VASAIEKRLAKMSTQLAALARHAGIEQQYRCNEREALQPILRRLLAIEQALPAEKPQMPPHTRRRPFPLRAPLASEKRIARQPDRARKRCS